jgi:hypothetical protein
VCVCVFASLTVHLSIKNYLSISLCLSACLPPLLTTEPNVPASDLPFVNFTVK